MPNRLALTHNRKRATCRIGFASSCGPNNSPGFDAKLVGMTGGQNDLVITAGERIFVAGRESLHHLLGCTTIEICNLLQALRRKVQN